MDVYLDSDPFETDADTLGGIIQQARTSVQPDGRIVVEVRLDGQAATSDELAELANAAPDAEEVQLITANPNDLAASTLKEVHRALLDNATVQRQAAHLLTTDQPAQAMDLVREALTVWQQVEQAVRTSAAVAGLSLDDLTAKDSAFSTTISDLASRLEQLREQLMANDWVGLADTLAFELDDATEEWADLIEKMLDQLSSP